jgi:heat shock protein HslJ
MPGRSRPPVDAAGFARRRATARLGAVLLGLSGLLACGGGEPDRLVQPAADPAARLTSDLVGPEWTFEGSAAGDSFTPRLAGTQAHITFAADGSVTGHAGCNRFFGSYTVGGSDADGLDSLALGPLAATKMACGEPAGVMQQEQRLLQALQGARRWLATEDLLRIDVTVDDGSVESLRFSRPIVEQAPPEPFTGMRWRLTRIERIEGDAVYVTEALVGAEPTALFRDDGTVSGTTGCNDWGAAWQMDVDGSVALREIASTEMACAEPEHVMLHESRFLRILGLVDGLHSTPGQLRLTASDSLALAFEPMPTDLTIRGGTSFGECLGYCREELEWRGTTVSLVRSGWNRDEFPERSVTRPADENDWLRTVALDDIEALARLGAVIGCPDCADGGAEWIEIDGPEGRTRVTYEYGRPPAGIATLAARLADWREELRAELDRPTVVR